MNKRSNGPRLAAVLLLAPGSEEVYRDRGLTLIPWSVASGISLAKVKTLHKKRRGSAGTICVECSRLTQIETGAQIEVAYPCPTIDALRGDV